jgi:hypothetical protein
VVLVIDKRSSEMDLIETGACSVLYQASFIQAKSLLMMLGYLRCFK